MAPGVYRGPPEVYRGPPEVYRGPPEVYRGPCMKITPLNCPIISTGLVSRSSLVGVCRHPLDTSLQNLMSGKRGNGPGL